jgi:16S rRNA (adenine(1408)-N(1))-methyltransferase
VAFVRQVVGKSTLELDATAFDALRAGYDALVVDIGTGDGKHVLAVARAQPQALVVGLDAGPDAMRPVAARAARKAAKGGVENACFVWAAVEHLPRELTGVTEIHVLMPWGSLLRAIVTPDESVLRAIAAACAPGARFLITLNLHAWRPAVAEVGETDEPTPDSVLTGLAAAYARAGWHLDEAAYLDDSGVAELGTSWTKRLGSSREALAVLMLRGSLGGVG